ncbi:MAG TPA: iron ABC transporter permease [Alphaproteobacteria bacterium]|jgi:iron(III) transport system permease protein
MTIVSDMPLGGAAEEGRRRRRFERRTLYFTLVLLAVAFVVVYPILLLLFQSFQVGQFGTPTVTGLDNWRTALNDPAMRGAVVNTLTLTMTRQVISFALGIMIAWLLARTDIPGRYWLEFGFWVAFFMPSLTSTLGWILLLDPDYGLVNELVMKLPFVQEPPFDIFSWWGIVFTHLATGTLAIKVMLLTPAFRNMDSSLEEASRASGASTLGTLWRVVIPIMAPTIFVVFLMGTIRAMEAFEIELILGAPKQIDVYSTLIYRRIFDVHPDYGTATALSMIVLALLLPVIALQQWFTHRRSHATVSGKYTGRLQRLKTWRWPVFALMALLLLLITVLPISLVVTGTFMKIFGYFNLASGSFTTDKWREALSHPQLFAALRTTLSIAVGAALLAMASFSLIAYISTRTRFALRSTLDFLTWLPSAIPGIVIGLGFLWLFLGTPLFRPLYGTVWILIIAVALGGMTLGVQVIKTNMVQLGAELEEASAASGANVFYTFRHVVLPLIAPAVLVVGLLIFASATREISLVALLSTGSVKPLSMLQLNYMEDGSYELATVIGVFILTLTVGAALLARLIGMRAGANAAAAAAASLQSETKA